MKAIAHGTEDTSRCDDLHQTASAEGVSTSETSRLVVKIRPILLSTNTTL